MNFLLLPDIAAMIILMGVLDRLRRKHRDSGVNLWMLGMTFILIEAIAVAFLQGSPALSNAAHALALDAYLLAAVTFGWAAREDMFPGLGLMATPLFLPPALPLLALTTIYGLNVQSPKPYVYIATTSLVLGVLYVLLFITKSRPFRLRLAVVHLILWGPMTWMAYAGQLRLLIYWGLGCLYLMVAFSFRRRIRREDIGGLVIVIGFIVWAFCFFAHPFVRAIPFYNNLVEQVWTMQKFLVIIGMLLVLLEDQTRRLTAEALHDPLTGLPNRRLFEDRLAQAMSRAHRTGRIAALFVIDLDNFKQINDTHGHRTGDLVLTLASNTLKSKIRAMDTLARCGGDEFNVIVNDLTRPEDCERIAEALRSAVAAVDLPSGSKLHMRGSVGYALFPNDVSTATELSELADVRMYRDKREHGAALAVNR